jgi:ankyrin repeat protein
VNRLPDRPNLGHLKKQAKDLIRAYRRREPDALARFRDALPAARGRNGDEIVALDLRLRDAQSCIAREYDFASWDDLSRYVDARLAGGDDRAARVLKWCRLVYAGDIAGTSSRANPRVALRMLAEEPGLIAGDPYLACAIGDVATLRQTAQADPAWVNRSGGPLNLPPIVAVAHSSLLRVPEFRPRLHDSARFLLSARADPNRRVGNRWPPASLDKPSDRELLSALYGAAGNYHDPELTRILLEAGASPNDGESLYHSLDNVSSESLACTRLLLEHGASFESTNAIYRASDWENPAAIELLLQHGADPNEPARNAPISDWGTPLLWAIYRRRSRAHIEPLLRAGANPRATTPGGISAYRLALQFGLTEVAEILWQATGGEPVSDAERFVAACARGDEAEARRIQAARPDLPAALSAAQLRLLPDIVAGGAEAGPRLMVTLGWPIGVRGGDWNASALNHAVFRGNASLARFLLEHGANWAEQHGFGDNLCGTLSWASLNAPVEGGDWAGCARALLDHGMPGAKLDPEDPAWVLIDGRRKRYPEEVAAVLLGEDTR